MKVKDLCLALANCDTEIEVIRLLTTAGFWQNEGNWKFFGDMENNYSSIGNQQDKPENALVEKIINCVDSMLTSECLKRDINPESENAPKDVKTALNQFYKIYDGRLTSLSSTERSKLADNISLIATGKKNNPSYTLIDKGEGQSPSKFKSTLLSLGKSNKLRIPFVQGKFNMGGTGVFRFCGNDNSRNVSLIISKRNPDIAKKENDPLKNYWGFTVIRRDSNVEGTRSSSYKYLTSSDGEILSFLESSLPLLPGKYPISYEGPLEWGCFMKFYEYQIGPFKSPIIFDLNYRLSLLMPSIALPVKLYERRGEYKAHSHEAVLSGLTVRIDEDRNDNIEDGFPSSGTLTAQGQTMKFSIYVFKRDKQGNYTNDEGVIFTINGQTHGSFKKAFFNRKSVGMGYLSYSILVNLDCSAFDSRSRENLFMNSRDRLCKSSSLKDDIETQLEDILKNHPGLRILKEKRRKEEIESKLHDQQPLADVLKGILKNSPTLSKLFLKGDRLQIPFYNQSAKQEEVFHGKSFPTYFSLMKSYSLNSPKEAHLNSRFRIQFKTDASNDYFDRDKDVGILKLYMDEKEVKDVSINLWNGYATLNILIDEFKVGDTLHFKSEVIDISRLEPFESDFFVKIYSPLEPGNGGRGERKLPLSNDITQRELMHDGFSLPNIKEVSKLEWLTHEFNEYSALKVILDDEKGHDFYINVDNIYLQTELKNSKNEIELVQAKYKFGMVLVGLALINEYSKNKSDDEDDEMDIPEMILRITKGLSPIIIPMIDSLSKIEIEELQTSMAEVADY